MVGNGAGTKDFDQPLCSKGGEAPPTGTEERVTRLTTPSENRLLESQLRFVPA